MNCQNLKSDLISELSNPETEQHLSECKSCRELYGGVEETMALMEEFEPVPGELVSRIMEETGEHYFPKVRRLRINSIAQIAAALLFGIFIGHQFGKIAHIQIAKSQPDPLTQYFKAHHFNVDNLEQRKTLPLY